MFPRVEEIVVYFTDSINLIWASDRYKSSPCIKVDSQIKLTVFQPVGAF